MVDINQSIYGVIHNAHMVLKLHLNLRTLSMPGTGAELELDRVLVETATVLCEKKIFLIFKIE
ncbi:MAG: hypothetical protein PHS13_07565 [Firmicutes bacterium]|nr:hypothetical protein [Bacillota bacterium]MDD3851455.1 hypothetical protein [Bacillota bacterium]